MNGSSEPPTLLSRLNTLSDMARLRILRLLEQSELSVGELGQSLQLPQSTVSRHLKMLHDTGWVLKRAEGTASLYRLDPTALDENARGLWNVARAQIGPSPVFDEDDARLQEVIAQRRMDSKSFFGELGAEWDELRRELFGEQFTSEALLSLLDERWIVADLGCGAGNAAELLAPHVGTVYAIDREPAMLEAARKRLGKVDNITFRKGTLDDLPLDDASVDATTVLLVMHHVPEPIDAITEIKRVLKPGGVALVVDMVTHDRETYRHTMGHQYLGFSEQDVSNWAQQTGLQLTRHRRLRPDIAGKGPGLFAATLRKPAS